MNLEDQEKSTSDQTLNFRRIEAAGKIRFNSEQREGLKSAILIHSSIESLAMPPKKTVLRKLRATVNHGRKYVELIRWIWSHLGKREYLASIFMGKAQNKEILIDAYQALQMHDNDVKHIIDSFEQLRVMLDNERSVFGKKPNTRLKVFIHLVFEIYRAAGGKHKPFWKDEEQDYVGPFLDMMEELLLQSGFHYQSRTALGKYIRVVLRKK